MTEEPTAAETRGASPVATGGGGVSFAHRVAAVYGAAVLTGLRRPELGDRAPVRISFQTGPRHPVDDLLIESGVEPDRTSLAIACRLAPNFVRSHEPTAKLVGTLLRELDAGAGSPAYSRPHQVAVAVGGWEGQYDQVRQLTSIARSHSDASTFVESVRTPGRWEASVRARYDQVRDLVRNADAANFAVDARADGSHFSQAASQGDERTWYLLSRLHLLSFRVQEPDRVDWTTAATALDPLTRTRSDGVALLDELGSRSSEYDAAGAVINAAMLRRDLHGLLEPATRTSTGWRALAQHKEYAGAAVRRCLGSPMEDAPVVALDFPERRAELIDRLRSVGQERGALVVAGASGVGKSAMVLDVLDSSRDKQDVEAVVLNFRSLPETTFAFEAGLGCPLGALLDEVSAPRRLLVIDAADAAMERSAALLADLASAAARSGLGVVAVSSDVASDFVTDQIRTAFGQEPSTLQVPTLNDDEISQISQDLPALGGLLRNLDSQSLMRRLVVLDLLARTGRILTKPLSEWECLEVIWNGLIRSRGASGAGSPEAREHSMLAVAAADLDRAAAAARLGKASAQPPMPAAQIDHAAVDSLQRDHLLAPRNLRQSRLEFAHDELRRYATAILLTREGPVAARLQRSHAPRWAVSAATLACEGELLEPGGSPEPTFTQMVREFAALARTYGPRWADVPLEAVFGTPHAYACLSEALRLPATRTGTSRGRAAATSTESPAAPSKALPLTDLLRVVKQRLTRDGLLDIMRGEPVVAVLVDQDEPWDLSDTAFEVLASWLTALAIAEAEAGNAVRLQLRTKLLEYWTRFPPAEPDDEPDEQISRYGSHYRRRLLDYEVTNEHFVEALALLGKDANAGTDACLRTIGSLAPGFLAPAADSPLSARSIASRDPELLADLIEAYYIDHTPDRGFSMGDEGIRDHQGRWTSIGPPFAAYYFGGFWALFNHAPGWLSARVLNRITNHAANARSDRRRHWDHEPAESESEGLPKQTYLLDFGIGETLFRGDEQAWCWYRGTSVGPNPCMSALQAMERLAERWLEIGLEPDWVIKTLLEGCENLAVPGMLMGLLTRNLESAGSLLDPFLASPFVWHLEFGRKTSEYFGWKASSDGLAHPERREWTPRETAMTLVLTGNEERREQLQAISRQLIDKGREMGTEESARNWAMCLDVDHFRQEQTAEGIVITVDPPDDVRATHEKWEESQAANNEVLRLQNLYWARPKRSGSDFPTLTDEQVASDLASAKRLLKRPSDADIMGPHEAAAHVARTAVLLAAEGRTAALGEHEDFAVTSILEVAGMFLEGPNQRGEGQYHDFGIDRSAATALPALLSTTLDAAMSRAGVGIDELTRLGDGIARRGPLETRLFLARGCDRVWLEPCRTSGEADATSGVCPHAVAFAWILNSARDAELGGWDNDEQKIRHLSIEGDLLDRLESLKPISVDLAVLDSAIRGLGAAASKAHCRTDEAAGALKRLLAVQSRAMVAHEAKGWTGDDRGHHTLVAARALLQTAASERTGLVLAHMDQLRTDAGLLSNFLHGLAGSGAENADRAVSARRVWPSVVELALSYRTISPNVFEEHTWGKWAASALLAEPATWSQGIYSELEGDPIDWVAADDLMPFIQTWIEVARGQLWCLDALVRFSSRTSVDTQVRRGLAWVEDLCIDNGRVVASGTASSNYWLIKIRSAAEDRGYLGKWQSLVDAMVVAGNSPLAPYST